MRTIWIIGTSALLGFIAACLALWLFSLILGWTIGNPNELQAAIDTGVPKLVLTLLFGFLIAKGRFDR